MKKIMMMLAVALFAVCVAPAATAPAKRHATKKTATTRKARTNAKAVAIAGTITTADGTVYSLKSNGRWSANKGYVKSGTWCKEGKVVSIGFDNADGCCFYYDGALYDVGTENEINYDTMRVVDPEDNIVPLSECKLTDATISWN